MFQQILSLFAASVVGSHAVLGTSTIVLAKQEFSLADRYPIASVNSVFADNIKLALFYMTGVKKPGDIVNWDVVRKPATYKFVLKPGEVFAFHDDVLPKYDGKVVKTTNSHFNAQEGFLSDGWLFGDGVCHFASFINVVARQANLSVEAPTRHDFANIPDVSREFGVSIYDAPGKSMSNELQNLYITNDKNKPIAFVFTQNNDKLDIQVTEEN